jgi:outer membrane protein OmpU
MKKQLLSTSALVAAGLIAASGTAIAQTAPASQPIQITVGGYMQQSLQYANQDDRVGQQAANTSSTLTGKVHSMNIVNDAEIWFQGKTTLANGISVAVRVELEAYTSTDTIDESFMAIEGAFGRIELGSTDHAAMKTKIGAPDIANRGPGFTNQATMIGNTMQNPTKSSGADGPFGSSWLRFGDNDSERISYYTPRFAGFQLGLSYTPEISQDRGDFVKYESNNYKNSISAGLNFTRSFGAFDTAAYLGYVTHDAPDFANGATKKDPKAYGAGAQVAYAGFRLGGSYSKFKDGFVLAGTSGGVAVNVTGTGSTGVVDNVNDGRAWDVGLTYTFGPAEVGVTYFQGKNKASTTITGDDKAKIFSVSGRYTLGPGVQLLATGFTAKITGEGSTTASSGGGADADNNKATGVLGGVILSF